MVWIAAWPEKMSMELHWSARDIILVVSVVGSLISEAFSPMPGLKCHCNCTHITVSEKTRMSVLN